MSEEDIERLGRANRLLRSELTTAWEHGRRVQSEATTLRGELEEVRERKGSAEVERLQEELAEARTEIDLLREDHRAALAACHAAWERVAELRELPQVDHGSESTP